MPFGLTPRFAPTASEYAGGMVGAERRVGL
jgi:hypothetical protein